MSAPQVTVKSVDQHSDHARIHFEKEYSDYHYFWLRHNCDCKKGCRHPFTNERVIDSTDVSLKIQPSHISVEDGGKAVKFIWQNDSHESVFESSWLREHAYALNRVVVSPPPHEISNVEIDFKHYLDKYPNPDPNAQQIINGNSFSVPLSEEGFKLYRADCANKIKEYGCIVVRNRGLDTESIIHDFLPAGKEVISTHFGRIEDLKTDNTTNQNTDQLGYTDAAVNLHTDQPFIANPPGMQLLQCVNPAEKGGDNFIVDATRAALYLRLIDPISFDLLTRIPVKFHRKQKAFESIQNVPIVQLEEGSSSLADLSSIKIKQLRYSYFTYAPHNVPFEYMTQWYEAYNAFSNLVRDPKHQYKFLLNSGDCVLYDNHRMFHARTSFAGKRHVRGVYFNTSDVYAKLNIQH